MTTFRRIKLESYLIPFTQIPEIIKSPRRKQEEKLLDDDLDNDFFCICPEKQKQKAMWDQSK